jgi:glutaminyl-peptide cyclotransferase
MGTKVLRLTILAIVAIAAVCVAPAAAAVPEYTAVVVRTFPHDAGAFTEGLLYHDGYLYESTGLAGQSSIRKVRLETGEVVQQLNIAPQYFGEGIVIWQDRLIELTWQNQIGFIYDLASLRLRSNFHYTGEGWALTQDGHRLIMSDGTSDLRFLDPDSLGEIGRIHVTCDGRLIRNVNELEWVKREIYANVWLTNVIVRIDPVMGNVVGLIDLSDLPDATATRPADNVLNGIAYDAGTDRLFVTGKLWQSVYQIRLAQRPQESGLCQSLP